MSMASLAEVATLAVAIFINLLFRVIVSGSSTCISSEARKTNSFVPPPPGITPIPNSTKPT